MTPTGIALVSSLAAMLGGFALGSLITQIVFCVCRHHEKTTEKSNQANAGELAR